MWHKVGMNATKRKVNIVGKEDESDFSVRIDGGILDVMRGIYVWGVVIDRGLWE